jgi:hypothetical protein
LWLLFALAFFSRSIPILTLSISPRPLYRAQAIAEMRGTTKNSMLSNEKVTKHNTIFENQMKKGYDGRGAQVGMPKGRARAQFGGAGVPPTRSFYDPNEPDPKRGLPYTGKKPWSVPGTSGAHLSQFAKKK